MIPEPKPIDLSKFDAPEQDREVKFGLPREVVYCSKCVMSNQRPNTTAEFRHTADQMKKTIAFDSDGVCDACRAAEVKENAIDWEERRQELLVLCDRFRSRNGSHDCLVPGSGGKDSFYTAHMLKYEFGMNPLTVTWAPHIYTPWGWENFQRWIHAGFDNYLFTPNGRVHRLLTRLAVDVLFHPFQPFILGQKQLAPKMAALHGIPLIFYGESEAEYGTPAKDINNAQRDLSHSADGDKSSMFLSGVALDSLKSDFGLTDLDLEPYLPADPETLKGVAIEWHYLGYYLKWHPQSCYYYSQEHGGFQPSPERTPGTYSKYNSIDDRIDDFHYYTSHVKFGVGRAMSDAAQEIRSDDITRDEGIALVRKFDGEFPERFAEEIFAYLSIGEIEFPHAVDMFEQPTMDRQYFDRLADQFRSPHLWRRDNEWKLRDPI